MNRHDLKRVAAVAALAAVSASAFAAEITLFDQRDFRGARVTLRADMPDFARGDFNDRAASAIVRDGTWEVCTDANFRGRCVSLQSGEYADLAGDLNDSISSARVAGQSYGGNSPAAPVRPMPPSGRGPAGQASAVLFEGPDFRGRSLPIDSDVVRNLDRTNFNDRAQSLRVMGGYWMFCSDANFEGDCRTFGPGDYADLPGELNRRISSGRRIADRYPYNQQPSWR